MPSAELKKLIEHDSPAGVFWLKSHATVSELTKAFKAKKTAFFHLEGEKIEKKDQFFNHAAVAMKFPAHFGKNLDALYDCMTDLVHKAGQQPGFVVVLEQLPDNPRFDREAREQLLDVFRDAADFWGERRIPFRCFYSFR